MTRIIFLHGFPDSSLVWSHQLQALSSKAECFTPDLHSLSFDKQIEKIQELVGNQSSILVAHDMGGPVAVEFAALYPEFVERLVLVNTLSLAMFAQRMRTMEQLLRSSYMSVFVNPLVNTTTIKFMHKKILNMIYNFGKLDADDELRQGKVEVFDGLSRYKEMMWKLPGKIFDSGIPLAMPVHFIFGEKDPFLLKPTEREALRFFDNIHMHPMDTGHWPMRTHAADFLSILENIIERK
jgi:pimeloyl-ACP methyl ester carboxylesterase